MLCDDASLSLQLSFSMLLIFFFNSNSLADVSLTKNSSSNCWSSSVNSSVREAFSIDWRGGLADEDGRETAKEVHTAGDEETNVEDGREEERNTDIGGTEVTHGGTARETRRQSGDEG